MANISDCNCIQGLKQKAIYFNRFFFFPAAVDKVDKSSIDGRRKVI